MKEFDSHTNEKEIKRYLYSEMSDAERAAMEESFFDNDELFYDVLNLENDLVDRYASGKMDGAEIERFERSLENLPERRAKIANAVALRSFIADERAPEKVVAIAEAKQSFGQKLAQFFSIKTPAFAYTMAGLIFLFAASSIFLLLDNNRKSNELARLQNGQSNDLQRKETDLQNRLGEAQTREAELKTQIDSERETSGDLTDELERERQKRREIEADLERLRREKAVPVPPATAAPPAPVIASILLSPITTRGGAPVTQNLSVERGTKRIAVRIVLPENTKTGERFSVALNGKTVAGDVAVLVSGGGQKAVQLTVSPNDLLDGANKLIVTNKTGEQITEYVFNARKK